MPICKRDGFDLNQTENSKRDTFHDNDLVFCCYITKRIFRDYDNYFRHVMAINSTVWQCEATGRDNLTYEEAVKSERAARKKMEQFKQSLRAPVLLVIESALQSSMKTLNVIVAKFLRKRYFLNEMVTTTQKKNTTYIVIGIEPPKGMAVPANNIYEDTSTLLYRLRSDPTNANTEVVVPFDQVRRQRMEFTIENLEMFIKNHVSRVDGILRPKPDAYKQYVTDPKVTFASIFIGKMPRYSPAKLRRPEQNKKQATLNKYIVKGEEAKATEKSKQQKAEKLKADNEAKAKSLKEEMERVRREKAEKQAEEERLRVEKKARLLERVEAECNHLLTKTDDLERNDQLLLPTYKPITTLIPDKLLGDSFMLREFMHSHAGLLSGIEVFRGNLSFYDLSRAMTAREVAGPLSDIVLILLGTIFDLQKEEEEEGPVNYHLPRVTDERQVAMANSAHQYSKRHFSFKINELPLDALTLSEVLRLHLLASGATVEDRADKWRQTYRNGYSSHEDPGLELCMRHSHIVHGLKNYPIYQFSFRDIMRVIRCLMAQILTYSGTINVIEERMEQSALARIELRKLEVAENRRLANVEQQRRKLTTEHNQQCLTDEVRKDNEKKQAMEARLNKRIAEIMAQSDRERRKHDSQVLAARTKLFNFLVYLGSDRCYRNYYVLESMPGIFVEHAPDSMDICLEHPPTNKTYSEVRKIQEMPKNRKDLRNHLLRLYGGDEDKRRKPRASKQSLENKENQEHHVNGLSAKHSHPNGEEMDVDAPADAAGEEENPTQYQLCMCTGDKRNCFVHDERNQDRQRWSYLYQAEEIEALIQSLNPLGIRESQLRQELTSLRALIEQHVKSCPTQMLGLDDKKKRYVFRSNMMQETSRKYSNSNFGLSDSVDLNEIMRLHLIDRIIQFENDIYGGDLGRLKVKNMEKWRSDLLNSEYDAQAKLSWGPGGNCGARASSKHEEDGASENGSTYDDDDDGAGSTGGGDGEQANNNRFAKKPYKDPSRFLGASQEIDSEDSADDEVPFIESETIQSQVRQMASALLQVEQAIEMRFLKAPFNLANSVNKKDRALENRFHFGSGRLHQWEVSLMESTSFAQVFLHLNILHDCIMWRRSTTKSLCQVCRRGSDPEKMLLCDECNGGTHMFCMKPKMTKVPQGNWYCGRCVKHLNLKNENQSEEKKRSTRKRKFIVEEEEDEDDELEESEVEVEENEASDNEASGSEDEQAAEDGEENNDDVNDDDGDNEVETNGKEADSDDDEEENICKVCWYSGSEVLCQRCSNWYHLDCVFLKRKPRGEFVCNKCKPSETRKTRPRHSNADADDDDEDDDEPLAKRSRSARSSLRLSLQNGETNGDGKSNASTNNNNNTSNKNNNRRSGRRTNDNLPLNSAALYDLLEQMMKHKAAWPFLRPVLPSEVPDYHKIIKSPMDLAKIKSKLNMGDYQLNEELLNDIQLVFRNCDLYNVQGNEIYDAGSQLERFVIARCKDMHLPFKPSDMNNEAIC